MASGAPASRQWRKYRAFHGRRASLADDHRGCPVCVGGSVGPGLARDSGGEITGKVRISGTGGIDDVRGLGGNVPAVAP